jgi:hypothetical protein
MGVEPNVPLVLYLVSEGCASTHAAYSSVAGRYAKLVIGSTDGWSRGPHGIATPEEVAEHWAEIADVSRFHQPHSVYEEFIPAIARVKAGAPPASSSNPEIAAP